MIDVTNVDMVKFVKKVYDLSRPQGLGMMHYTPKPLTDDEAKQFIQDDGTVDMDYVGGRACKMHVFNRDGVLSVHDSWYDHSDTQFSELLAHVGLGKDAPSDGDAPDHGCACNCDDCRVKRGAGPLDPKKDFDEALKAHENGTALKITSVDTSKL